MMTLPMRDQAEPTDTAAHKPDLAGRRVHFIGIGGCGMSGLARLTKHLGARCSGSDQKESATVNSLKANDIPVALEQSADSLPDDCDMVVISAAIRDDHPELTEAVRRGIQVKKYAVLLGELMIGRTGVAIAGTHGKSTTTSMLSHILIQTGLDPSFIVGANCRQIGGGVRVGESDILVAEACEYDRSFHNFHPTHAAILNVEADHLDLYSSLDEIVEAFKIFAERVPPRKQSTPGDASGVTTGTPSPAQSEAKGRASSGVSSNDQTAPSGAGGGGTTSGDGGTASGDGGTTSGGTLLINHEMPHRIPITAELNCAVETIGFAYQADWRIGLKGDQARLHHGEDDTDGVMDFCLPMPGEHMAYNAAVAAITAHRLGASWPDIAKAIEGFTGLDRRMQLIGCRDAHGPAAPDTLRDQVVTIVDDYAHHPTEVDTTLRALRHHYKPNRLICVFQPHQHSRTRFFMDEFAASFSSADTVIVPHIYFVRDSEKERHAVTAGDLVDRLRGKDVDAMHLYPFAAIVKQLELITRPGDLVVTMGAGDVWQVARDYLKNG
jgi:UDP-N-acetylmuramate--alanine ligase